MLGMFKAALQVYLQLRPTITPPQAGFMLNSRLRRWYRGASGTLRAVGLCNHVRVLEVGGGVGTFTVPLAEQVAPDGYVCSVELQSGMLKQQARAVRRSGLRNIQLHQADALRLPFADNRFDRAVLIAVLPLLRDKQRGLREVGRVLKPGGLLVVSEDLVEPEYVPVMVTRRWCRQAGFVDVATTHDGLCYTVVFRNGAPSRRSPGVEQRGQPDLERGRPCLGPRN